MIDKIVGKTWTELISFFFLFFAGNQVELNVTGQFSSRVLDLQSITTIQERFEKMKILSDKQKYILGNLSKNLTDMKLNKLP